MSSPISSSGYTYFSEEDPLDSVCFYIRVSDGSEGCRSGGRATLYCHDRSVYLSLSSIFRPENRAEGEQAARDFFLAFTPNQIEDINQELTSFDDNKVGLVVQRILNVVSYPSQ